MLLQIIICECLLKSQNLLVITLLSLAFLLLNYVCCLSFYLSNFLAFPLCFLCTWQCLKSLQERHPFPAWMILGFLYIFWVCLRICVIQGYHVVIYALSVHIFIMGCSCNFEFYVMDVPMKLKGKIIKKTKDCVLLFSTHWGNKWTC